MKKQVRILLFRGGALGDFIFTLPALAALRQRWPDAYIELVGYPHIANLALAGGLVDHVESLDRAETARFFAWTPAFSAEQADHIASFDLVINYLHDPDGSVRRNLQAAGARQVIVGSPIVTGGHAVAHLARPLESLALYVAEESPRLSLTPSLLRRGSEALRERGLPEGAVVLHPG
ncbi:MAG: hypothetical protein PHT59_07730, partial [Candidatus Omnitrophica bacterium]|nr:hypothetical protein [Candidatus Omnitrophota bacterium]